MTFKSIKGKHIVTINGKPMVFASLIEAIRKTFEVKK